MLSVKSKPHTGKRLLPQTWERIRIDHEIKGMSFNELQKRYEVHRSNIARRARKQGWNREGVQQALDTRITAEDGLERASEHLRLVIDNTKAAPKNATEYQQQFEQEADTRKRISHLITSSSLQGLELGNSLLALAQQGKADMPTPDYIELMLKVLDTHSKALLNYSRATFGNKGLPFEKSQPDPANAARKSELIRRLREEHQA